MSFRTIAIRKDPECPACGTREIRELRSYEDSCRPSDTMPASSFGDVIEISPSELAERLKREENLDLIDVREPGEWSLGHIPGARLVPLAEIPGEIEHLDPDRATVLYCKVGGRSRHAARQLAAAGIRNVANLAGGILAWRDEIDPSLPRY